MVMIVETGEGLSNANSFSSVSAADDFHDDRNPTWQALDAIVKERLLVLATDFLHNEAVFPWRGSRKTASQALSWPRTGVTERNGPAVADNVVPAQVVRATAELAFILNTTSLQPVQTAQDMRLKRTKVDVIEREFFESKAGAVDAMAVANVPSVMGLLAPLLRTAGGLTPTPYAKLPTRAETTAPDRPFFHSGQFDNT